jgi:excisionase family DNA binding protein
MEGTLVPSCEGIIAKLKSQTGAMSAGAVAKLLGISGPTLYRLVQSGSIPHFRVGCSIRFDPVSLCTWLLGGAR